MKLREVRVSLMLPQRLNANLLRLPVLALILLCAFAPQVAAQPAIVPPEDELSAPFDSHDRALFLDPPGVYHPETWFHFIGGNVAKPGITADLEAIAAAGISGIHLFHGQFGGAWPGVAPQIACLSESWDDAVRFTAGECRRLGLRFTMQNCPGWAMSGGPWIEPSNAMRNLVWSRTDAKAGPLQTTLPIPQPSTEDWRDYQDIAVLAFPTPLGDSGKALKPDSVESDTPLPWRSFLSGETKDPLKTRSRHRREPALAGGHVFGARGVAYHRVLRRAVVQSCMVLCSRGGRKRLRRLSRRVAPANSGHAHAPGGVAVQPPDLPGL